jgi:hypothetical protein
MAGVRSSIRAWILRILVSKASQREIVTKRQETIGKNTDAGRALLEVGGTTMFSINRVLFVAVFAIIFIVILPMGRGDNATAVTIFPGPIECD